MYSHARHYDKCKCLGGGDEELRKVHGQTLSKVWNARFLRGRGDGVCRPLWHEDGSRRVLGTWRLRVMIASMLGKESYLLEAD